MNSQSFKPMRSTFKFKIPIINMYLKVHSTRSYDNHSITYVRVLIIVIANKHEEERFHS